MELADLRHGALFQKKEKDISIYQYKPVASPLPKYYVLSKVKKTKIFLFISCKSDQLRLRIGRVKCPLRKKMRSNT